MVFASIPVLSRGADTVGLQKHHDLPDGVLIGPTRGDFFSPLGANAVEFSQSLRSVLDDIFTERLDHSPTV